MTPEATLGGSPFVGLGWRETVAAPASPPGRISARFARLLPGCAQDTRVVARYACRGGTVIGGPPGEPVHAREARAGRAPTS